ncbi:MAG: hypothetical protein WCL29_09165 [Pseudomonadota bacterium]
MTDEILAEVYAIKDALSKRFGGDINAIYADIKKGEAELRANGFKFVAPPINLTVTGKVYPWIRSKQ